MKPDLDSRSDCQWEKDLDLAYNIMDKKKDELLYGDYVDVFHDLMKVLI